MNRDPSRPPLRRVAVLLAVAAGLVLACGSAPSVSPDATPEPTVLQTATPTQAPTPARTSEPSSEPSIDPEPASPSAPPIATPSAAPTRSPTPRPSATPAAGPTVAEFWSRVERGIRSAGRVEVDITGPNTGSLRFEPDASATVIDDVVGFVCVGGRAYDGQSAFTRLPGRWTCGAPALVAGFRSIGQPIDAWNATIPTDSRRRERLTVDGDRWTWTYRATSPYYGGAVSATVVLDRASRRVVEARRTDPTGATTYDVRYGVDFPPIAVPR